MGIHLACSNDPIIKNSFCRPSIENTKKPSATEPVLMAARTELHNTTTSLPPPKQTSQNQAATPSVKKPFPSDSQYSDEQLEEFQTRFSKEVPPKVEKPAKKPDSFYGRVEAELAGVMQRVAHYGSHLAQNGHVRDGLGMLAATVSDLQMRVQSLRESTAQQSAFVVDNVKKSVSKMVHNVKNTAERITRNKHGGHNEIGKSLHKLKMGVVNSWCHIKGKLNGGATDNCFRKNTTKPVTERQPEKKFYPPPQKYQQNACYKGYCGADYKRAKYRQEGRQPAVNDWYSKRTLSRQQNRHQVYPNNKWQRNRGR